MMKNFLLFLLISLSWLPVLKGNAGNSVPQGQLFTLKEKAWLRQKDPINICVDSTPFEQINAQGEYEGLVADYIALIFSRLGVNFELYPTGSFNESLSKLASGKCAVLSSWGIKELSTESGALTKPYLKFTNVFAVHQDVPFTYDVQENTGRSIGVLRNYPTRHLMHKMYPDTELLLVDNEDAGVRMVANGEIDVFASTLGGISHSIQKLSAHNVKIGGVIPGRDLVTMLINENEAALVPLLNNAIDSITLKDRKRITNRWFSIPFEQGFNYGLWITAKQA